MAESRTITGGRGSLVSARRYAELTTGLGAGYPEETMHISERARLRFAHLKSKYLASTYVPAKRLSWSAISPDEIWLRVFCQVVEVGRSDPSSTLRGSQELLRRIGFSRLARLPVGQRRKAIHSVLREIKARYCSGRILECRKTAALMKNLDVLQHYKGGPRGFLKDIMAINGPEAAQERIEFVTAHFGYIKNKGARDLLTTGWRVADDYLAFDIRWQKALKKIGVDVPAGTMSAPAKYAELERVLIAEVAQPLGLSGKQLDQLVFNNYDAILKETWSA